MFTAAGPVGASPNAAGAGENRVLGTIAAVTTFSAALHRSASNGAILAADSRQIDVTAEYQLIDVLASNNVSVTAGTP